MTTIKGELVQWFHSLPTPDRHIVLMHLADGLTESEMATALGIPEEEVRERMRRHQLDLREIGRQAARVAQRWRDDEGIDRQPRSAQKHGTFTLGQVAAIAGVSVRTASKWCDSGLLKCYRLPGCNHRRIEIEHLREFMRRSEIPSQRPDLLDLSE